MRPVRENEVVSPSDMIAISDTLLDRVPVPTTSSSLAGNTDLSVGFIHPVVAQDIGRQTPLGAHNERWRGTREGMDRRHGGRLNVSFVDGHIENHRLRTLFAPTAGARQRWNNDNLPHEELRGSP